MSWLAAPSCRYWAGERPDLPHGSWGVLKGGGPSGLCLAQLHVSHGGDAMRPTIWPLAMPSPHSATTA
eukprot:10246363-Lingulodinium_polyedra.AAC.1